MPRSVWELLPRVEPALAEWAAFFAAGARKRAAAEAGLPRAVSAREADDLLRDAETFLTLAEDALGVPGQPLLPLRSAGLWMDMTRRPGRRRLPRAGQRGGGGPARAT
jgi:hypothetical protein